jgi:glycosyltransferase involved in cell wall biosynthesis
MPQPKKILIDLLKLNNLFVGLGQVSLHYGKAIAAIAGSLKNEMEFTFLVPTQFVNYFGDDVKYQTPTFLKRYFSKLNSGFDVWHAIHQDSDFMPDSNTKYILTIHDLNFLSEKNETKAKRKLNLLQQKINKADAIFSISNYSKSDIEKHVQLHQKNIQVIYNGVESLLNKASIKPNHLHLGNFLLAIGNLTAKKNFHVLLPMMKLLPQYNLVIAGNDGTDYAKQMKNKIASENIKNVFIVGKVAEQEKNYLMNNCQALVFPSLLEGFGLPVIEAMSCGKPTFVSRLTSLPEIAADKGFYFKNFDANTMANLIESSLKNNSSDFSNELIKHASQFNWDKNATEYIAAYRQFF